MKKNVIISTLALCILAIIPGWGQTSVIKRGNSQQSVSKKPAVRWADKAYSYFEGLCWVKDKNGKYGYIDEKGKQVIPCKWKNGGNFSEGLAHVEDDNDRWGFIDKTGNVVIEFKWGAAGRFHQGLAAVKDDNGKWGFIDRTGKLPIPCKWDAPSGYIPEFRNDGLARVNGQYEINKLGEIVKVVSFTIYWGRDSVLSEGLVEVKGPDGRYGYVDKDKTVVIPFKYHSAFPFHEGMAIVKNETNKFGFIDKTGKEIVPCKYWHAENFSEGMALVKMEQHKCGFIDKKGNEIVPCTLYSANGFREGLARVSGTGFSGFINKSGELVIKKQGWEYSAGYFSEGLAKVAVKHLKSYGYIDKQGKMVIPGKWNIASDFHDGLAKVYDEKGKYFIDKTGNIVIEVNKWVETGDFYEGLCYVRDKNGKYGFINQSGEIVIPCQYQWWGNFKNGKARVKDENGKEIYIDKNGNVIH